MVEKTNISRPTLMSVYPDSTLLKPCPALHKLFYSIDHRKLQSLVLGWIRDSKHAPTASIQPPRLKGSNVSEHSAKDGVVRMKQGARNSVSLDQEESLNSDYREGMRARTYEELEEIWKSSLTRNRIIERLTDFDWPEGITYSMIASIIFETTRWNRMLYQWNACCLDYGDGEEVKNLLGKKDAYSSRHRLYQTITPAELVKRISEELSNYCSHSIFLDTPPTKAAEMLSLTETKRAEEDWTKSFTRIRIVSCESATSVCNYGLNILHIPKTPWCLVSGYFGVNRQEEKEMLFTAIAHAFGAQKVLHNATRMRSGSDHTQYKTGILGELHGRDPLALREVLVNEYHVLDGDVMSSRLKAGKGKAMDRNQAEDGPLVRADKRKRDDKSGLYEKIARHEKDRFNGAGDELNAEASAEANSHIQHPREQKMQASRSEAEKKKREREVNELFGQDERLSVQRSGSVDGQANEIAIEDLPRFERTKYDLILPMPEMNGYGDLTKSDLRKSPIQLRLDGTHVLAGLRKLVRAGLDGEKFESSAVKKKLASSDVGQTTKGLPEWLVDIRGTRVCVGLEDDDNEEEEEEAD
ncbi:uncharacterized protein FA14DRAFT_159870 [Meira miltonrushii]|uniref:CHL4-domain-containing protein n=1 Tax=Meira miltonrushii TaxID=1280837 RepID=A0A316VKX3_9BASI|nr:uncharacterized protein FA14DRAFT_159870 [Meira miltonrushii]PWN38167.1 hypothetical protein FA14DRAFT_159870 [Meira miltonrushii]